MTDIATFWYLIPSAFILDLLLGDPRSIPHPVRWMGACIEKWEHYFRSLPCRVTISGCLFVILLVSCTFLITWGILYVASAMHTLMQAVIEIIAIYYCLSVKSLRSSAMEVYKELKNNRINMARERVSYLISRDVKTLDCRGISRGAVESVAENLVDGVISPLFFALIGGVPLAMAYKMVNTLDSMIGYKDEKYKDFGKFAAYVDDVVNFIPARLSVIIISFSAVLWQGAGRMSFLTALTEGKNNPSPNAGFSEAAFAGALNVKLGGPNFYKGELIDKPIIGTAFGDTGVEDIRRACNLMIISSIVSLIVFWGFGIIFRFFV